MSNSYYNLTNSEIFLINLKKLILHEILFLFGILTYNIRQYLIFTYKQY